MNNLLNSIVRRLPLAHMRTASAGLTLGLLAMSGVLGAHWNILGAHWN
jgi:hypothetical protein